MQRLSIFGNTDILAKVYWNTQEWSASSPRAVVISEGDMTEDNSDVQFLKVSGKLMNGFFLN